MVRSGSSCHRAEAEAAAVDQLRTLTSSSPTTEIAVFTESRLWLRLLVSMVAVGLRTCRVEHLAAGAGGERG